MLHINGMYTSGVSGPQKRPQHIICRWHIMLYYACTWLSSTCSRHFAGVYAGHILSLCTSRAINLRMFSFLLFSMLEWDARAAFLYGGSTAFAG